MLTMLTAISLVFIFSGCSSGGGGDGDGSGSSEVANSIGGIWEGNFISNPLNRAFSVIGLASEEDEVHFISNLFFVDLSLFRAIGGFSNGEKTNL